MNFKEFLARYLCPDLYAESVPCINLEWLRDKGVSTLLIDLDNTLVSWKSSEVSDAVLDWLKRARELGYKIQIVSNSLPRRVARLSGKLGVPALAGALKPRRRVFRAAMTALGSNPHETAVIGDQLFTDILGGKRMGFFTILVPPVDKRELFTTLAVRLPEKGVLRLFEKHGLLNKRNLASGLEPRTKIL